MEDSTKCDVCGELPKRYLVPLRSIDYRTPWPTRMLCEKCALAAAKGVEAKKRSRFAWTRRY